MTRYHFALALTIATVAVPLMGANSVLTPDGTRYSIAVAHGRPELVLTRATEDMRDSSVIPTTEDEAVESHAQLAYDGATATIYAVWVRDHEGLNDVRVSALGVDGEWGTSRVISAGLGQRLGLQVVLTHASETNARVALLHLAWWRMNAPLADPELALVAFEGRELVSSEVANLETLAGSGDAQGADTDDPGAASHPPLTMAWSDGGVDVVFGSMQSTAVTLLKVDPRKIIGNPRAWVPIGRVSHKTPRANLVSPDGNPVQAFISRNGRVVLYVSGERFSFVVLENDEWSPVRSLRVDEKMTADALVDDLRRTVDEIEMFAVPEAGR